MSELNEASLIFFFFFWYVPSEVSLQLDIVRDIIALCGQPALLLFENRLNFVLQAWCSWFPTKEFPRTLRFAPGVQSPADRLRVRNFQCLLLLNLTFLEIILDIAQLCRLLGNQSRKITPDMLAIFRKEVALLAPNLRIEIPGHGAIDKPEVDVGEVVDVHIVPPRPALAGDGRISLPQHQLAELVDLPAPHGDRTAARPVDGRRADDGRLDGSAVSGSGLEHDLVDGAVERLVGEGRELGDAGVVVELSFLPLAKLVGIPVQVYQDPRAAGM